MAFITKLPGLDKAGYEEMLNNAAGHEPPAADEANGEHSNVHIHDDGSEHIHDAPTEPDITNDHDDATHEHNDS